MRFVARDQIQRAGIPAELCTKGNLKWHLMHLKRGSCRDLSWSTVTPGDGGNGYKAQAASQRYQVSVRPGMPASSEEHYESYEDCISCNKREEVSR